MGKNLRTLGGIAEEVSSCTRCSLWKTRTLAVPGGGDGSSGIMFVGEAPGRTEDLRGRPFAGAAGKKLDAALESAGLDRKAVYITNVVKCRPPGNRVPTDSERAACAPFLQAEIASLKPKAVCVMGNTALQSVLGRSGITENRGLVEEKNGTKYYATVHPAATIYNNKLMPALRGDIGNIAESVLYCPLPRSFYCRDTVTVARQLLGKKLVRRSGRTLMSGIITETEAYKHSEDAASHAHRGRTGRNAAMFGERGRAYVYFTYGMHYCFNVVARANSAEAGAVLIRAVEPLEGVERMIRNRKAARAGKSSPVAGIADGPAKLAQAMHITKSQYGKDLTCGGALYVAEGVRAYGIKASARIGVSDGGEKLWNFTCSLYPRPRAPRGRTGRRPLTSRQRA